MEPRIAPKKRGQLVSSDAAGQSHERICACTPIFSHRPLGLGLVEVQTICENA